MYRTAELAAVTIDEFRRGLEGLTADEALVRHPKADGTSMNAASWIVQHVAGHWANVRARVTGEEPLARNPSRDGTPPPYAEALTAFEAPTRDLGWLDAASDDVMASSHRELGGESVGTFLMRAVLHTWFHTGELNAVRQLLGHPEIAFVGPFDGRLGWVPERGIEGR